MLVEQKLFILLRADSIIAKTEASWRKQDSLSEKDYSKLAALKNTRRRLNREFRCASPILALAKVHIEHLRQAELMMEEIGADTENGRLRYGALTGIEIGNKRLQRAMDRVNLLTERFQSENTKSSDEDPEKQKNTIRLTALEAQALRMLAKAGGGIVPTKELTDLVKEWRRKSHNANYNLISALRIRLRGSGIRIENEPRKGYMLIDPLGKIGQFLESAVIIPDPLLTEKMEDEKVLQDTANTEAACINMHLEGKSVEAIARELKLPVNRVNALIVSAEIKRKLGL